MKFTRNHIALLVPLALALGFVGCTTTSTLPDVTEDGLTRVKGSDADVVYVLPGAQFGGYTKVALLEPEISFRKNWQSDKNMERPMRSVSDSDMEKMIAMGKKLLKEEFTKELTKGGFVVSEVMGPDVLIIRASVLNLDIYAPDPNNIAGIWTKTYTDGAGEATMAIELYDSVTRQLLARAFDNKVGSMDGFGWRVGQRTQFTNINDARMVFGDWGQMLVEGLKRAKSAK